MISNLDGRLAFVFPGQGSQSVGMLHELAESAPSDVVDTFSEASDALDFNLWGLVCDGPAEELNRTQNTQPAMLAAGVAVWRVWSRESGIRPAWMAGHSLGEYTALVCSGRVRFADAIRLVRERGRLMQEAVPVGSGAMAALLGLSDQDVIRLCEEVSSIEHVVAAANFNAPGQVVVAGHTACVQRVVEAAKAAGAKRAMLLPVSVPSHCSLMDGAAEQLRDELAATSIDASEIRVIHNVDVQVHPDGDDVRLALAEQMCRSVRWTETVQHLAQSGVDRIIECGPGKVLTGLNKRIAASCQALSIHDRDSLDKVRELFS
jgi:[acyl-carrier-protein] S-malonyltransferase